MKSYNMWSFVVSSFPFFLPACLLAFLPLSLSFTFINLFKKPTFDFPGFLCCLTIPYFIYFCSNCSYLFLHGLGLFFILIFSSFLRWKDRLLICNLFLLLLFLYFFFFCQIHISLCAILFTSLFDYVFWVISHSSGDYLRHILRNLVHINTTQKYAKTLLVCSAITIIQTTLCAL